MANQYREDDFDSSGSEYEEPVKPHFRAGEKSVEAMHATRFEDRKKSKKRLRTMVDSLGAPPSVYLRTLWANRLEKYCIMNNIAVDITNGPDADTIIRFLSVIVEHMDIRLKGKEVPQLATVKVGFHLIIDALVFKYPDWKLSRHELKRVDTMLDSLAKEGLLLRGRWRKKQWLGVAILEKLARSWFQAGLDQGVRSWDVHLHKILSIVFMSALLCRAGEITLSNHYTTEFMKWEDIELKLNGGKHIEHLEATITLKYCKNKKSENNVDRIVFLGALSDSSLNVLCPIKLLLIQALRSGNTLASSLDELLENAWRSLDKTVQWRYPKYPVIPSISRSPSFMAWDKRAPVNQVTHNIKEIGLVGGVLADIISHDLRRGGARDLAHLKSGSTFGVATSKVSNALGHSTTALHGDLTRDYVGLIEEDLFTKRIENKFESRAGPNIGAPYKKVRLTGQEVTEYCRENDLNEKALTDRRTANRMIKDARKATWATDQKQQPKKQTPLRKRTSSEVNSKKSQSHGRLSESSVDGKTPDSVPDDNHANNTLDMSLIDPELLADAAEIDVERPEQKQQSKQPLGKRTSSEVNSKNFLSHGKLSKSSEEHALLDDNHADNNFDMSLIDSELLAAVHDADVEILENMLSNGDNEIDENQDEDSEDGSMYELLGVTALLDNVQSSVSDQLSLPPHQFVEFFARINVVHNTSIRSRPANLDELFQSKVPMGNTRDYPSLFVFKCAVKGCEYTSMIKQKFKAHVSRCNPAKFDKPPAPFPCDRCSKGFQHLKGLQRHIHNDHEWVPKKCPVPGCECDKVWESGNAYETHLAQEHKPIPPTRCLVEGCKSEKTFILLNKYKSHLIGSHGLNDTKAQKPYLPDLARASFWVPSNCPVGGKNNCSNIFAQRNYFIAHVINAHKLSKEEARTIADDVEISQKTKHLVDKH